jgi:hypothetical protein
MRFRLGLTIGFGAGYYLGSMAGRERYEQINRLARKVKRSDAFETATEKTKAVVDLGVERAKDAVGGDPGSENPNGPAEAGPLARPTPISDYTSSR